MASEQTAVTERCDELIADLCKIGWREDAAFVRELKALAMQAAAPKPAADVVERPDAAIAALTHQQQQLDSSGILVGVSRQALDEVLAYVAALSAQSSEPTEADMLRKLLRDARGQILLHYTPGDDRTGYRLAAEVVDRINAALRTNLARAALRERINHSFSNSLAALDDHNPAWKLRLEANAADALNNPDIADACRDAAVLIETQAARIAELKLLVRAAYDEGFNDGCDVEQGVAAAPLWEDTLVARRLTNGEENDGKDKQEQR